MSQDDQEATSRARATVRRAWLGSGAEYTRPEPEARTAIEREIELLRWTSVDDDLRLPASTALALRECVRQLRLPRVSQVAHNGRLAWTDGQETVGYGVYGIEATRHAGRVRVYVLDRGTELVPLARDLWPTAASEAPGSRSRPSGGVGDQATESGVEDERMTVDVLEERRAYDTGEAVAHVWRAIEVILGSDVLTIADLAAVVEEGKHSYMAERDGSQPAPTGRAGDRTRGGAARGGDEVPRRRRGDRITGLIVGYDCRVYAHVDADCGEVVRVVVDEETLADPTYVEGPAERKREALAIADRAPWPPWRLA